MTVGARKGMTSFPAEIWEDPQPKLLPHLGQRGGLWLGAGGAGGAEVLQAEATDGQSHGCVKMQDTGGALSPENTN